MAMLASSTEEETGKFKPRSKIQVGKQQYNTLNDEHFCLLRREYGIPFDFLKDFDFNGMDMAGGKGGSVMAFTDDKRFLVKDITGGDSTVLCKIAPRLVKHMLHGSKQKDGSGGSLITRIFAHFQTTDKRCYVGMAACLPLIGDKGWDMIFDLKGCRDDKLLTKNGSKIEEHHMRCWAAPYFCCLYMCGCTPPTRSAYYQGKVQAFDGAFFFFTDALKKDVLSRLQVDTSFFQMEELMDYSLIVGIRRCEEGDYVPGKTFPAAAMKTSQQPYLCATNGEVYAYYIGIIDFLQDWTSNKACAACIKSGCAPRPLSTVPPQEYGDQFYRHFASKFSGKGKEVRSASRCPAPSMNPIAETKSASTEPSKATLVTEVEISTIKR